LSTHSRFCNELSNSEHLEASKGYCICGNKLHEFITKQTLDNKISNLRNLAVLFHHHHHHRNF